MSMSIEKYLNELDQSLAGLTAGDRAEIVLEIKSHLLEAQAKNGGSMETAIASMGTPSSVAAKFLAERGLKPKTHYKLRPFLKWVLILSVGGIFLLVTSLVVLMIQFSPLLKIDGDKKTVSILDGWIEIHGGEGTIKIGDTGMARDEQTNRFDGTQPLKAKETINIALGNGRIHLRTSLDDNFTWSCKVFGRTDQARIEEAKGELKLDLADTSGADCEIGIPRSTKTKVDLKNGKVRLERPLFHAKVEVVNGGIEFIPVPTTPYNITSKVTNGNNQFPVTGKTSDAFQMDFAVTNGFIRNRLVEE
jgi:hypothetical protein